MEGVEPKPGEYDDAYLASITRTVRTLRAHGIMTLLDAHQDMYNEKFEGEEPPTGPSSTREHRICSRLASPPTRSSTSDSSRLTTVSWTMPRARAEWACRIVMRPCGGTSRRSSGRNPASWDTTLSTSLGRDITTPPAMLPSAGAAERWCLWTPCTRKSAGPSPRSTPTASSPTSPTQRGTRGSTAAQLAHPHRRLPFLGTSTAP